MYKIDPDIQIAPKKSDEPTFPPPLDVSRKSNNLKDEPGDLPTAH